MPLPSKLVGQQTEPVRHEVDARWLMAFAAGIDDLSPRHLDTRGPIVGHPIFPVCVEWPAVLAARTLAPAGVLTRDERLRGVHATHDLLIHRPVEPLDELTTTATVESVEVRTPGAYEVLRLDTVDGHGLPVATTRMGSLFLGVAVEGEVPAALEGATGYPVIGLPPHGGCRLSTTIRSIPARAAHVYTECSHIFNPIHTDALVAERAGLAAPILHGTATLAMAVSEITRVAADADPTLVRRVSCRFGAMVAMPSSISIRVFHRTRVSRSPDLQAVTFDVLNAEGQAAIRDGVVLLGPPEP